MVSIDTFIAGPLADVRAQAVAAEAEGVDGLWMGELNEDVFLYADRAVEHTSRVTVGTSIAVALARSPMTTAYLGYSLNRAAEGRFILGLGAQVRTQIEDRFGMPWDRPVARMTEYVAALRAIWSSWQNGERLHFAGDFYRHTSMDPPFTPPPSPYGPPKIYLAAVNPGMVRAAAAVADGMILMLTPPDYLRERVLPAVEEGLAAAGRPRDEIEVCLAVASFMGIVRVESEDELSAALDRHRGLVPYYFSVPNYRPMLELYGHGDLQPALHEIRYSDLPEDLKWQRMAAMVPDELLLAVGTYASAETAPRRLREKYGTGVDRYLFGAGEFYEPWGTPKALRSVLA